MNPQCRHPQRSLNLNEEKIEVSVKQADFLFCEEISENLRGNSEAYIEALGGDALKIVSFRMPPEELREIANNIQRWNSCVVQRDMVVENRIEGLLKSMFDPRISRCFQ